MIQKRSDDDKARDTGLALVLICLLAMLFGGSRAWLWGAIVLLVATMTWPNLFRPLAGIWFGLSHHLGSVVSKVVLTLLFVLMLLPVALVRRLLGKDSLRLNRKSRDAASAFVVRDQTFSAADLERPF